MNCPGNNNEWECPTKSNAPRDNFKNNASLEEIWNYPVYV